jgi:hypothetical protein
MLIDVREDSLAYVVNGGGVESWKASVARACVLRVLAARVCVLRMCCPYAMCGRVCM